MEGGGQLIRFSPPLCSSHPWQCLPCSFHLRATQQGKHFVIFVHGFQGNSLDLSLIKGHLTLAHPALECFASKTNEVRAL